jgi:hypothetical protein
MLKLNSLFSGVLRVTHDALTKLSIQPVREIQTKDEYFRRFGYHYQKHFKGGDY